VGSRSRCGNALKLEIDQLRTRLPASFGHERTAVAA
jgi:hypothetical protein